MEHQLACGRGSVDPLLKADQIDLLAFEVLDGLAPSEGLFVEPR